MASRATHELLYDSEATLRLVDSALADLRGRPAEPETPAAIAALPQLLLQAYGEIINILGSLREGRGALERAAVEKIHRTHEGLREVSSATEVVATDIMDAVDRALGMVDELDAEEGEHAKERSTGLRASIRDELFGVMNHLEAVRLLDESRRSKAQVARELGIHESMLKRWKAHIEGHPSAEVFPGNGNPSAAEEEVRRLRRENEQLRQERDFLRKTAA